MWIWLSIASALFLGFYDIAKKQSLKRNGVLEVLLVATAISTVFLLPSLTHGDFSAHLCILLKAVLVTTSWVTGLLALKTVPITTVSTFKATRPVFVLLLSILIYGERLNAYQWGGSVLTIVSIFMLSRFSKREGVDFLHSRGVLYMVLSVFAGVGSALWDKHILGFLQPLFVQGWTNMYVTALLAVCIAVKSLTGERKPVRFAWDWNILAVALLITAADSLYFYALHDAGAMLSVVSMVRRSSVIVTFVCGALMFREKQIRSKAAALLVLLLGMLLMVRGS